MLKVSHFLGESEAGLGAVPLFGPADSAFEKVAAPSLLPEVTKYIEGLRPVDDAVYVLVNALGAGEYYGSNINGDHFPEASLLHLPDSWTGQPIIDKAIGKNWAYGFPTFYNAHPFAHHRNKDARRAFGEVELATWNPRMRRVELVTRVDKNKALKFGGIGVWDKLKAGMFPDVSMGTKVPYDTCSICLDWDRYNRGMQKFDPAKDKHPGQAILALHKQLKAQDGVGIKGLSVTRKDYCEHAKTLMNRILPDGRKVFVYNDYPRFFDISFVFIGADKTAKVMVYLSSAKPSAAVAEDLGYQESLPDIFYHYGEKTASVADQTLKMAFLGKSAKNKNSEIKKRVVPSQFAGKAVPLLTKQEEDFPPELLETLSKFPLKNSLSTLSGLGMLLRPREFQRTILIRMQKKPLADDLERRGEVFPRVEEEEDLGTSPDLFLPSLARLLMPLMAQRSALGPIIERRVVIISSKSPKEEGPKPSHPSELLRKIGAAYNGYRRGVMELVANSQQLIAAATLSSEGDLQKLSSAAPEELFTPLTVAYLSNAFRDEVGFGYTPQGVIKVSSNRHEPAWRGVLPSVNT
jgi:hypothetical protein